MKTMKIMTVLALTMILATGNMYAGQPVPRQIGAKENKAKMITYLVRIEHSGIMNQLGSRFLVMMTDELGNQVAPAQLFVPGQTEYKFKEGGTARGARTARLVQTPVTPRSPFLPPTTLTGVFYGGGTYLFVIDPIPAVTDSGSGDIR